MVEEAQATDILALASDIVAAQISKKRIQSGELPELIRSVVQALTSISAGEAASLPRPEAAVSIKKSVTPDFIICLEDGKKLKMLKRHLRTAYKLTPDEYRARWNLPAEYPMVAPNYAKKRRRLAKAIGLGTKPRRKRA